MGFFDSSESTTISQTYDERFVLNPSGGTAAGQSGDNSVLSTPGSFATRDIGSFQAAAVTFQNFDPDILTRAYNALDTTNALVGKFSADVLSSASNTADKTIKAGETAAANADGQQYDLSQLAALATVAGLLWAILA
jgi:hypothetical protein